MPSKGTVIMSNRVKEKTMRIFDEVAKESGITRSNLLNTLAVLLDADAIDLSGDNVMQSIVKHASKEITKEYGC